MKAVRQGRSATRLLILLALAGCSLRPAEPPPPNPDEVRAKIARLMPTTMRDRQGWASDIYMIFSAQQTYPSDGNPCAALAVTEQESTYQVNLPVAGLDRTAIREVEHRAGKLHVPAFLASSALNIKSPDSHTYSQRLAVARMEKGLNETFDDFTVITPMGGKLFDGSNPIHTDGPMQVSTVFTEQHVSDYPYPLDGSTRREVFSRRGGMYFDTAHLLGYPANYPTLLYRLADFNADWHISRSATFQNAVGRISGIPLALDGDLVCYGTRTSGSIELTVRSLGKCLDMNDAAIRRALEQGDSLEFADGALYRKVFALAESIIGKTLPRTVLPGVALESPKITRKLTAVWSVKCVDERYQHCMARVWER